MKLHISLLGIGSLLACLFLGYSFSYREHVAKAKVGDLELQLYRHGNIWNGCWMVIWEKDEETEPEGHAHIGEQYYINCGK